MNKPYDAAADAARSYDAAVRAKRDRGDAKGWRKEWPADAVVHMDTASLIPYARNARMHGDTQVAEIAASIREWGFTVPVLVDEAHSVIAGHGRLLAAQKLGLETVPVMVAKGWTDAQIRAYRIADNKLALNAAWDEEMLALELAELPDLTALMGFAQDEVDRLMAQLQRTQGLTDPDETPPLPEEPETVAGDLWLCGKHRLLCGDATKAEDVARLLGEVKPNLMVTDPPYGVEYDAEWRSSLDSIDRATRKFQGDDQADWGEAYALFPGDVAYVWHAGLLGDVVANGLRACGLGLRAQIVWVKPHFVISRGDYHLQHEPCWYAVRNKGHWQGDRTQSTVWEIANRTFQGGAHGVEDDRTGHSTQKPVECMRRPIVNNSNAGQAVYDPFIGSGTTMIAAEMEARSCLAMEISPAYCDVTKTRWENFTGEKAEKWQATA